MGGERGNGDCQGTEGWWWEMGRRRHEKAVELRGTEKRGKRIFSLGREIKITF